MTMLQPSARAEGISLTEQAYREIRQRLITLKILPGEPLNDDEIGRELGIGRTPVREAIKRLETDHLVVSYPKRGTFATRVEMTDLAQILEVRCSLEPLAASLAARNATSESRQGMLELAAAIAKLDPSTGPREVMEWDKQVHSQIYNATNNQYLLDTLIRFDNLANRIWYLVIDRLPPDPAADELKDLAAILRAVAASDGDEAGRLMLDHLVHMDGAIRKVV